MLVHSLDYLIALLGKSTDCSILHGLFMELFFIRLAGSIHNLALNRNFDVQLLFALANKFDLFFFDENNIQPFLALTSGSTGSMDKIVDVLTFHMYNHIDVINIKSSSSHISTYKYVLITIVLKVIKRFFSQTL